MAVAPVRHLPDIGPQPALMSVQHQSWSKIKTIAAALAELDSSYGLAYASAQDVRGWNAAMCQMVTNKGDDCGDILTMMRTGMSETCLNRQDVHGMTIAMLGIFAQQQDRLILPFLQDARFDVGLQDAKQRDVLWYAAYFGRTELVHAIRENPFFQVAMYEAALKIAHEKRKYTTHKALQTLRDEDDAGAIKVAGGLA